jgi:hypothetical protein
MWAGRHGSSLATCRSSQRDAVDPAELPGADVDQLARPGALVADHRNRRLGRLQPAEPEPAQDQADGRARDAEPCGDLGAAQALTTRVLDLADPRRRHRSPAPGRSRAPIQQRPLFVSARTTQSAIGPADRETCRRSRSRQRPVRLLDPQDNPGSTLRHQPRFPMNTHAGLRVGSVGMVTAASQPSPGRTTFISTTARHRRGRGRWAPEGRAMTRVGAFAEGQLMACLDGPIARSLGS